MIAESYDGECRLGKSRRGRPLFRPHTGSTTSNRALSRTRRHGSYLAVSVAAGPVKLVTSAVVVTPLNSATRMNDPAATSRRNVVILRPGEGRNYPMGRISALFKADGNETANQYSISEWWPEPHTKGPGAHEHAEDAHDLEKSGSFRRST